MPPGKPPGAWNGIGRGGGGNGCMGNCPGNWFGIGGNGGAMNGGCAACEKFGVKFWGALLMCWLLPGLP